MTDLSPQAQAVLDAANGANSYGPDDCLNESRWIAAAGLRAAVNRVLPIEYEIIDNCWYEKADSIREQFLAIADELEGNDA